jgi:hypothetical protein
LQTALALLGAAVGIASIGILLSSALPTRQAAFATTLLVVILAWMVFPVLTWQHESSYSYTWSGENGFKWQVAYLWPGLMLLKLTNNWNPGQHSPILWLPDGLTGIGCAMAWGIVAAIALSLAARMNARKGGIPDE